MSVQISQSNHWKNQFDQCIANIKYIGEHDIYRMYVDEFTGELRSNIWYVGKYGVQMLKCVIWEAVVYDLVKHHICHEIVNTEEDNMFYMALVFKPFTIREGFYGASMDKKLTQERCKYLYEVIRENRRMGNLRLFRNYWKHQFNNVIIELIQDYNN